jgi:predicted RNA-binding Zn-ribbon protein involved in translation (DUF1610 family)
MAPEPASKGNACPHCGKPVPVRWSSLLPSNNRNRSYKCPSCGGLYDLSDGSKMASIMGGLVGMGPGVLIFGRVARAGGNSKISIVLATAAVLAFFSLGAIVAGRLALGLVRKP